MLPLDHPDRIQIAFDDHRLVANAGLLLPPVNHICQFALPHLKRYPTRLVASNKMLPKIGEAIAWEEASARWQNRNCWRRSETATELHRSGRKAGFWTSSSRLPATIASMASGCWGSPSTIGSSSRR